MYDFDMYYLDYDVFCEISIKSKLFNVLLCSHSNI